MKMPDLLKKYIFKRIVYFTTEEEVSVVSESEVLVMFVTVDSKELETNISEMQ
jgi:hypothetical protein